MAETILRCHVCGKDVRDKFQIFALMVPSDHPFIVHDECTRLIDKVLKGKFVPAKVQHKELACQCGHSRDRHISIPVHPGQLAGCEECNCPRFKKDQ